MIHMIRVSVCMCVCVVLAASTDHGQDAKLRPCVESDLQMHCDCESGRSDVRVRCSCRDGESLYLSEDEAEVFPAGTIQLRINECSNVTLGPDFIAHSLIRYLAFINITNLTIETDSLNLFRDISVNIDNVKNLTLMPRAVTIKSLKNIKRSFNINVTNSFISYLPEDFIVNKQQDLLHIYAANNSSPCKCENIAWLTTKNLDMVQKEVARSITCPEGLRDTCSGVASALWSMLALAGTLVFLAYVYHDSSCPIYHF